MCWFWGFLGLLNMGFFWGLDFFGGFGGPLIVFFVLGSVIFFGILGSVFFVVFGVTHPMAGAQPQRGHERTGLLRGTTESMATR